MQNKQEKFTMDDLGIVGAGLLGVLLSAILLGVAEEWLKVVWLMIAGG